MAEAEALLVAANFDIKVARAAFFPSIQLTGSYGFSNAALNTLFTPGGTIVSLAAGLTQPLFDGGLLRGQLEQAKGRYDELLADYRKAVVQAFTDVEDALTAWRFTTEQEALQRQAVATAQRAANIARAQMQAGTVDVTTVLQAETTLFNAEDTSRAGAAGAVPGAAQSLQGAGRRLDRADRTDPGSVPRPAARDWCPAVSRCRWEATSGDASRLAMDSLTREPADLMTRPRSRRWLMAVLCLLVIAGIGYAIWFWPAGSGDQAARNRNANQPIPVLVATAEQKDVPIYLDALGTVQAFNTVTVKPMVDGPLNAVNFTEGQDVKKGDVLAQIDPRTYQAALDQATAKKAQDEAQLANARLDLARYTKLAANNYTSGQQADTARAQVAQLEALVKQDQAQIDNARTQLGYTTITSPLDGRTGMRQVDAGNIVHASDATGMVVITQLQPISVVFTLAAADARGR